MTRRTIADATSHVEGLAGVLPRATHAGLVDEVDEARTMAQEAADRAHQTKADYAEELAGRLGDELAHLAANVTRLTSRTDLAEDSSASIAAELADLQRARRIIVRKVDELGRAIDQLRDIEQDPVGWVDATLYAKYPVIRPEFSF